MSDKLFTQSPHPLIEDHYHIRELIEAQQKRAADRTNWQEQKKNIDAFQKYVDGFKNVELLDFYCERCEVDFVGRARKQVDSWDQLAYYKIKHRCGTWCMRLITHRFRDKYFFRSKKVAYDRSVNSKEMLQPFQTGYNMMYGKQNAR